MDSNKVISITNNLDSLQEDFRLWSSLPLSEQIKSDNICKETYNLTNRELYNKLQSSLLLGKEFKLDNSSITESFDYSGIDRKDLIMKIAFCKQLNQDITIAVLYPYDPELFTNDEYKAKYKEEFLDIYQRYLGLTHKYKKYSNSYSLQLFGYNVYSMYDLISPDLDLDNDSIIDDIHIIPGRNYVDSYQSTLDESTNDILMDKNIVELYKFKILHCTDSDSGAITEGYNSNQTISEVNQCILSENTNYSLTDAVPYFSLAEFNSIVPEDIDNDLLESVNNSGEYFRLVCKLYDQFQYDKSSIFENQLVSIGWNPYVDPRKFMDKVKEKQSKWFSEHCCHIIDISDYDTGVKSKGLIESSYHMQKIYKENNIYPVYITLSYTNTVFGHIIRKIKKAPFTHAGLTLDSNLKQILTFMFDDKNNKGFMVESIDRYMKTYDKALLQVMCIFVDKDTLDKLNDSIQYFINNKHRTKYNFKNLINILRNKAKDNDPENLSMICSQFVDTILKLANIDLTHKSSNLVTPKDLYDIDHPKVFQLYSGLAKEYDELKVEGKIDYLLSNSEPEDITYNDFVNDVTRNTSDFLYRRYNIKDNDKANKILKEFYDFISKDKIKL